MGGGVSVGTGTDLTSSPVEPGAAGFVRLQNRTILLSTDPRGGDRGPKLDLEFAAQASLHGRNHGETPMELKPSSPEPNQGVKKKRRQPGRPAKTEPAVTPAKLETIAQGYLMGKTLRMISDEVGVSHEAIRYHLNRHIRPSFAANTQRTLAELLAELRLVAACAWSEYERSRMNTTQQSTTIKTAPVSSRKSAKFKVVERTIKKQRSKSQSEWLRVIRECMELEDRLLGYSKNYQPPEPEGLRYAGCDPEEVNAQMLVRLAAAIEKRRETFGVDADGKALFPNEGVTPIPHDFERLLDNKEPAERGSHSPK